MARIKGKNINIHLSLDQLAPAPEQKYDAFSCFGDYDVHICGANPQVVCPRAVECKEAGKARGEGCHDNKRIK